METLKKIKKSFSHLTVKIALVAILIAYFSQYMPWLSISGKGISMMDFYEEISATNIFYPLILFALLWEAEMFLLNHPKLSLIGTLMAFFWEWFLLKTINQYYDLNVGIGHVIFVLATVVSVVMAFMTRKDRPQNV